MNIRAFAINKFIPRGYSPDPTLGGRAPGGVGCGRRGGQGIGGMEGSQTAEGEGGKEEERGWRRARRGMAEGIVA